MSDLQNTIAVELLALWTRVPHLRLCQLVSDIAGASDNFYVDDETFLSRLRRFSEIIDQQEKMRRKEH